MSKLTFCFNTLIIFVYFKVSCISTLEIHCLFDYKGMFFKIIATFFTLNPYSILSGVSNFFFGRRKGRVWKLDPKNVDEDTNI